LLIFISLPRLTVQSPPPGVVITKIVNPSVARRLVVHARRGTNKARLVSLALTALQEQAAHFSN
jgi:hypothetical protein